ncbi:MAG: 50S ribosomal protein L3 [Nitrospinota bacterium]|nr:50S ribosomal protein L3 [Nitrospinota bacterium]
MKSLLGKKIGMTQYFTDKGNCVPVTLVQVERCIPVLQRTSEKDGYEAVLLAYGNRKPKHTNKPLQGFYDKLKIEPGKLLAEIRDETLEENELGKPLNAEIFNEGDRVSVVGTSKGKGFSGVFRRFGFGGNPASRGAHESYRGGGSIGCHTYPGKVFKGKEMAGRMGGKKVYVRNLQVVSVDKNNNVLLLKGAVPGANGQIVKITRWQSAKV